MKTVIKEGIIKILMPVFFTDGTYKLIWEIISNMLKIYKLLCHIKLDNKYSATNLKIYQTLKNHIQKSK